MTQHLDPVRHAAVAVVGLAGRFPGASTIGDLWTNLRAGKETIAFFSDDELRAAGESLDAIQNPAYVKAAGRLDDIAGFDAPFFGMSPRDASICDPQHRLFLECAWEALEHAGYVGERVSGPVGVFAASGAAEYLMHNLLRNRHTMDTVGAWLVRHTGNDPNFLATRVSYELNLKGPSMSVQTACSSSLAAVHVACQSLLNGECDMALAGGATVYPAQTRGYFYKEGEILSPDGHCRAFDARSAGTVMASAVGCVVLKRLEDALRDGDRVLAIVRGSAVNNDGSDKVGYLAPSVTGQARVVSEALAMAGIHPEDVSYIEAHGTGTLIGDPIEITALTTAFRASTDKKQFCAIGSIKTNFGHAGEAAGICGLIKTVLALDHREIPPSLHFETPNPQVDFPSTPFFVNTALREWRVPPGKTRIAGVTALGAGGTNVHVLLEEGPVADRLRAARAQQLLVLSARTPDALDRAATNLAAHLHAHPDDALADTAYTLLAGRQVFPYRRAIVAADALEAAVAIEQADPRRVFTHASRATDLATYFMFPGGGAQYPGMGAELYGRESVYRARFDEALDALEPAHRDDIRALVLATNVAPSMRERLETPSLALPALFATEYALAHLLLAWGVTPTALIGHSAGEYAAACLAGVLTPREAMTLVAERGRLFDALAPGAMLSVQCAPADLASHLPPSVSYAAVNAPNLCVLSGPVAEIDKVERQLRARGLECARIHIGVAAHSAMLDPLLPEFERICRTVTFARPRIPFVSNVTGTWITDTEATDPEYWVRHLRGTVRFADGARTLLEHTSGAFCEVGPGRTLSSLLRQQERKPHAVAPTLRHPDEEGSDITTVLSALGRLWVAGVALDERRLFGDEPRRRVALPTYPFERQRYWVDPDPVATVGQSGDTGALFKRPDVGDWFYAPSWARSAPPAAAASPKSGVWLVFTDESRLADELVNRLRLAGHRVIEVVAAHQFAVLGPFRYAVSPSSRADFDSMVRALATHHAMPDSVAHLWPLTSRGRSGSVGLRRNWNALDTYAEGVARHYLSVIWLVQALASEVSSLRLYCVSSRLQSVPGDDEVHPEKATLLGPCKVIPREYPHVRCSSIDVGWPSTTDQEMALAGQLVRELTGERMDGEVALRGTNRWVRRFDPVRLEPTTERPWIRSGGVYVITGGLGGLGLAVAEHLARHAPVKLALIARRSLPATEAQCDAWIATHGPDDETTRRIIAVRGLQALGTDVLTLSADVSDRASMRRALSRVRARFGAVHGVFHAAGILNDELIALRSPSLDTPVLDAKVRGTLVLDEILAGESLELFVLFSSVSSILGLPGQAEYTAANAFLDAFAHARDHHGAGRTLAIDWNAWQQVGMLAAHVEQGRRRTKTRAADGSPGAPMHPALHEVIADDERTTIVRVALNREDCWVLGEHVVRGGDAPLPGTGFLDFVRAALTTRAESRPVELRDVLFLRPLIVGPDHTATLHIRIERQTPRGFSCYGLEPDAPYVVGTIGYLDAPPAASVDLAAIRERCHTPVEIEHGQLVQHFMDLGPRWGSVGRIDFGFEEALLELQLRAPFVSDLDVYHLHPALLDLSTGGAQALVPDFDAKATFYVPFSYGRILIRRPLTAHVFSHVRLRQASKESITFDAVLYDDRGNELVAVEHFVMRRAAPAFGMAATPGHEQLTAPGAARETASEAALRIGMAPQEGLDALDRILAVEFSPQVVACTTPLDRWMARLDAEAVASDAKLPDAAVTGPAFARPSVSASFVAPSDAIEQELATMWCGLLGLSQVGVNDDFFELGGQSLVAVRLFQRIGKQYNVELPLATLFEAPTIAGCAALIRKRLGTQVTVQTAQPVAPTPPSTAGPAPVKRTVFRALVAVQEGQGLTPFFCVHGAGGNVLNFRDLARAMDPAQPVYGLQAAGVDGLSRPRESVVDMANAYLEEIRALQAHGPYLLGGYSGGGIVAFEMARRLTGLGEPVVLLALIDTFHPQMPLPHINVFTRLERLRREGVSYVQGALERFRQSTQEARDERAIQDLLASGEPIPHALRETYVMQAFERAARGYRPTPWPGKATLFRATEVDYFFQAGGPAYGWERDIMGGIDIITVPGDHNTLMVGGNAGRLARALTQAIDRALTAPGEGDSTSGASSDAGSISPRAEASR